MYLCQRMAFASSFLSAQLPHCQRTNIQLISKLVNGLNKQIKAKHTHANILIILAARVAQSTVDRAASPSISENAQVINERRRTLICGFVKRDEHLLHVVEVGLESIQETTGLKVL